MKILYGLKCIMVKNKTTHLTAQNVIIVCVMILIGQSGKTLKTPIRQHMIAVSDTAVASLNGNQQNILLSQMSVQRVTKALLKR